MSFNWTPDELQEIVSNNPIVLFMKGTPNNQDVVLVTGLPQFWDNWKKNGQV